jgi:two-component system chemotaxis sensor kinase CheA
VLTRNQLLEIARRHEDCEFNGPLDRLSNVTAALQEGVMKTRMQPIGRTFQQLPRIVRDIAAGQHKEIDVEMHGTDTELDRAVLEVIKDPLAHMVRNSADHGLETPDERRALGKPERGVIRLNAYHEGSSIIIEVADDGRGLNTEKIRTKAIANGVATAAEIAKMSEAQIHKFIFTPGFSTAAHVTSISGRGVGLDVVGTNIDLIGGTIDVKSVPCEGARFIIKIPLTLAIVSALIVEAGGNRFAIPQLSVTELVRVEPHSRHCIEWIKDAPVLRLRNKLLPLVHLRRLLNAGDAAPGGLEAGFAVVVRVGRQTFGIVVDGVFHTEEIVVKPLASKLRHIALFSGITILGDGSVVMIVDANGVAREIGTAAPDLASEEEPRGTAAEKSALLIFCAGSGPPKAVPLSLVTRIEQIDAAKIEMSGGRPVVQYRGALMPLLGVDPHVQPDAGAQLVLVFSEHGRAMGLMVDRVVDIVEDELKIRLTGARPGVLGSAIVRGQATEVLDIGHYLLLAFPDGVARIKASVDPRPLSLVLVDDSAFFRDMLTPVLRAAGYAVTALASGEEALACVRSGRAIDALVTDIEMPRMDGYELASAIRRDPRLASVPIIALASAFSPDALRRGQLAGFEGHVAKFDRPGLLATLQERLARAA